MLLCVLSFFPKVGLPHAYVGDCSLPALFDGNLIVFNALQSLSKRTKFNLWLHKYLFVYNLDIPKRIVLL